MLDMKDMCPRCCAWHGVPPLEHLTKGGPCPHDPAALCAVCGGAVGALSTDGSSVCAKCASNGLWPFRPLKEPDVLTIFIEEVDRD